MSNHNGDSHDAAAHGGDHAAGHETPADIIPETSLQDKLLVLAAALALAGLLYFGYLWAFHMPPATGVEHEPGGHAETHSQS